MRRFESRPWLRSCGWRVWLEKSNLWNIKRLSLAAAARHKLASASGSTRGRSAKVGVTPGPGEEGGLHGAFLGSKPLKFSGRLPYFGGSTGIGRCSLARCLVFQRYSH